jgi:DNA adenine methylase
MTSFSKIAAESTHDLPAAAPPRERDHVAASLAMGEPVRPSDYDPCMQDGSAEPFLKWAGGKRVLVPQLKPIFPAELQGRYFEPFLGAGALFFALGAPSASLSDANTELIECFEAVRDDVDSVIHYLSRLRVSEAEYYRIRARRPRSSAARAARFIYLNKACFNGLYRVNLRGEFNVPFGRQRYLRICRPRELRAASGALQQAELAARDFEKAVATAQAGDWIYFDPPYTTAHVDNGFIEYNARVFAWRDQERLAETARQLGDRGVNCVISNANHSSIMSLYRRVGGFAVRRLERWSTIAARSDRRFHARELVLLTGPVSRGAGK